MEERNAADAAPLWIEFAMLCLDYVAIKSIGFGWKCWGNEASSLPTSSVHP
jgi:hypothetical protein